VKLNQNYCGKSSIQNGEESSHQKIGLKHERKLLNFYTMSTALYGTETETLREIDQKYLKYWNVALERDGGDHMDRSV